MIAVFYAAYFGRQCLRHGVKMAAIGPASFGRRKTLADDRPANERRQRRAPLDVQTTPKVLRASSSLAQAQPDLTMTFWGQVY